jgi:hypothetical protein
LHFVLTRDWFVGIQGWTVLNLLSGQVHRDDLVILAGRVQRVRRNENPPAAQPTARISNEISNRPTLVIEVELFDLADLSIAGAQFVIV